MDKPKFRYNHKTKSWDELYRFNMGIAVISGIRRPDGTLNSFTVPRSSLITAHFTADELRAGVEKMDINELMAPLSESKH